MGGGSFITNHRKKTKKRFLPYGRQTIDEADISAVVDVLRGDWLTTGPSVNSFEKAFSNAVGSEHAVACSSGTAALHLMLMGLLLLKKTHLLKMALWLELLQAL